MTKKIIWRLREQPTAELLLKLTEGDKPLLSKDEAREILFNSETEEDRDKKSLESEIKFLRELVEKLSQRSQIVEVIKEIQVPYYHYHWYQPYQLWCGGTASYTDSGSLTLTANTCDSSSAVNFSDIKTF